MGGIFWQCVWRQTEVELEEEDARDELNLAITEFTRDATSKAIDMLKRGKAAGYTSQQS